LKKSFRKNNRSTRRKSKTNKRKSRKIRGGGEGTKLLEKVGQIEGHLDKLYSKPNDSDRKKEIRTLVDEFINHNPSCVLNGCKDKTAKAYELLKLRFDNNEFISVYTTEEELTAKKQEVLNKIQQIRNAMNI